MRLGKGYWVRIVVMLVVVDMLVGGHNRAIGFLDAAVGEMGMVVVMLVDGQRRGRPGADGRAGRGRALKAAPHPGPFPPRPAARVRRR